MLLNNGSEDAGPFRFQIIPQSDETAGAEDQQDTASEVTDTSELPYGFTERITAYANDSSGGPDALCTGDLSGSSALNYPRSPAMTPSNRCMS